MIICMNCGIEIDDTQRAPASALILMCKDCYAMSRAPRMRPERPAGMSQREWEFRQARGSL